MKNTARSIEAIGTAQASESVDLTVQQSGIVKTLFRRWRCRYYWSIVIRAGLSCRAGEAKRIEYVLS